VALARQLGETTTGCFLDVDGIFCIGWVDGAGAWNPPVRVGGNPGRPGGAVAVAKQTDDTFTWNPLVRIGEREVPAGPSRSPSRPPERSLQSLLTVTDFFVLGEIPDIGVQARPTKAMSFQSHDPE